MIYRFLLHLVSLFRHSTRDLLVSQKRSSHWPTVEKEFKKLNPTCAVCDSNIRLQIHHILPFHLHPELELDKTNLIPLCMSQKECHFRIGHGFLWSSFNPNVIEDAKFLHVNIDLFDDIAADAKNNRLSQ